MITIMQYVNLCISCIIIVSKNPLENCMFDFSASIGVSVAKFIDAYSMGSIYWLQNCYLHSSFFFSTVYKFKLLRRCMNYRIAACCPKVIFLRNFHTAQLLVHMRTAQSKSRIDVNFCIYFVGVVIGLQIYLSSVDSLSYSRKTNNKIIDRTRFFNENFISKHSKLLGLKYIR